MLKFKVNKEEFDKLEESVQAYYSADGENYVMQIEGATSKDKLDEFRNTNVDLLKQVKANEGINMDKYNAMLETERKVRDKELIASGDFDTLVKERTASMQSDFQAKIDNANNSVIGITDKYNQLVTKTEIEGAAHKAFVSSKIRPEAQDAVMSQIRSTFSVDENGAVVGKNGDAILTGADGNLTISEFVSNQPDFMRVPNQAGGGQGNEGDNHGGMIQGKTSQDKISNGLAARMK